MANPKSSRVTIQTRDAKVIVGISNRLPSGQSVVLGGVPYTHGLLPPPASSRC